MKAKGLKKGKHLWLIILGFAAAFAFLWWFYQNRFWWPHQTTVTLTDNGFEPNQIRIKPGETVTFVNATDREMWPASNPHPAHSDYAEFDPEDVIAAGSSWTFTFEKRGLWRFHDHFRPKFSGEVLVRTIDQFEANSNGCNKINQETPVLDKQRCWNSRILTAYEKGGYTKAFGLLKKLYDTDPDFSASCHSQAHLVGDLFYADYVKDQNEAMLKLPHETVYCGYGFYHGLFEHLFRERPDTQAVLNFCDQLTKTLGETIPRIRLNCFHGAGHGFVATPNDKNLWGNPEAMVAPALPLCEQVSPDEKEVAECMQGSFNVISAWMFAREYGLSVDEENFLDLCDQQSNRQRQLACYYELSMYLGMLPGTPEKIVNDHIVSIKDPDIAKTVINVVVASWMQQGVVQDNQTSYIRLCNGLSETLHQDCLQGLVGGLMAHGKPDFEYERVLSFCQDGELLEADKNLCYRVGVAKFKETYRVEKVQTICQSIPPDYQSFCAEGGI